MGSQVECTAALVMMGIIISHVKPEKETALPQMDHHVRTCKAKSPRLPHKSDNNLLCFSGLSLLLLLLLATMCKTTHDSNNAH